ncbi:hypothetical protein FHR90_002906 [Endobacter medicaginis]|uniref:Murein transglycosylase n=4 Tax=Endobacter medicaginis TaxID=1181271 RepID=A0A839V696_9PROT|nr:lytic transglycosylase domain-containing protein [Endobacter medicaginis]MBB3175059.1 hypothetical protein [Endobacter medicaginis]MCX5476322.1 lytic transglycosylase domain-containing protein [Endobacter medicaginis]
MARTGIAPHRRRIGVGLGRCLPAVVLCMALAACGGPSSHWASRDYTPPGPASDPWGPYIGEASSRFSVPDPWIRAVMHQESGGHQYIGGRPTTSASGAMGLMQLMPATYAELQQRYGLGSDPYDPHDNIIAGTGYIRQLYDKYGSPGFLAAYNAGPGRLDDYLTGNRDLPRETVDYVNAISPHLGGGTPGGSGGSATMYAAASPPARRAPSRRRGNACVQDVDAAYDPSSSCAPAASMANPAPVEVAAAPSDDPAMLPARQQVAQATPRCPGNPDAAFDAPCPAPAPVPAAMPAPAPVYASAALPGYRGASVLGGGTPPYDVPPYGPPPPAVRPKVTLAAAHAAQLAAYGDWGIQVGAFDSPAQARTATSIARQADYGRLGGARSVVQATTPPGRGTLYRARLAGLARQTAGDACAELSSHRIACMVVAPGG